MEPFVPWRADAIFDDLSRESDKNCATFSKNVRDMARRAFTNKTCTPTAASNYIAKIGIKVNVSTLCRDSQRPENAPLPTCGTLSLF